MKTKTKKKIKYLSSRFTKKKILKRRSAQRLARVFFICVLTLSAGSLVYAISNSKPGSKPVVRSRLDPPSKEAAVPPPNQVGTASWYAIGLYHPDNFTCASTTFPRGSYLSVKNLNNNRSVVCLVNDYGPQPFTRRVIDLSRGSFRAIESLGSGLTRVEVRLISKPSSTIDLNLQILGYSLCYQRFTSEFCEINRHSAQPL